MKHFETETEARQHVIEKFETLVDAHGIDRIHEAIQEEVCLVVNTRSDAIATIFTPSDVYGMPTKGRKIQYRKAMAHGKGMGLVGARSGSKHKLIFVFNPNVSGNIPESNLGTLSLPSTMKKTSRLDIGVEVTARELIDVFDDAEFERIYGAVVGALNHQTGADDPRFADDQKHETDTDDMPDDRELAKEGFGAW